MGYFPINFSMASGQSNVYASIIRLADGFIFDFSTVGSTQTFSTTPSNQYGSMTESTVIKGWYFYTNVLGINVTNTTSTGFVNSPYLVLISQGSTTPYAIVPPILEALVYGGTSVYVPSAGSDPLANAVGGYGAGTYGALLAKLTFDASNYIYSDPQVMLVSLQQSIAGYAVSGHAITTDGSGNILGSVNSVVGSVGSVVGNVGGSLTGNVGGSVTGSVGSVAGNVVGSVGSVVGNVGGSITGSIGGSLTGSVASVVGNVGGSLTGNVGGNVAGSVGSVLGNVGGSLTGNVGGSLTGNVGGNVTGNIGGSLTGAVGGSVTGNVGGNVLGSVGSVNGNIGGSLTGNVGGNVNGSVNSVVGSIGGSLTGGVGGGVAGTLAGALTNAATPPWFTGGGGGGGGISLGTLFTPTAYTGNAQITVQEALSGAWASGYAAGKLDSSKNTVTLYDAKGNILRQFNVDNPTFMTNRS